MGIIEGKMIFPKAPMNFPRIFPKKKKKIEKIKKLT